MKSEILGWFLLDDPTVDLDWWAAAALPNRLLSLVLSLVYTCYWFVGWLLLPLIMSSLSFASSISYLAFCSSKESFLVNSPMLLSFLTRPIFLHSLTRIRMSLIGSQGQKWSKSLKQIY